MPKRVIVSRQATILVVGANGPVDCGKWSEVTINNELEVLEHKPLDGSTEYLVEGAIHSGTLKRGVYDPVIAQIVWESAHPGTNDPPRHLLLITEHYNDGSIGMRMEKEVLFKKHGESIARGAPVTEDIDWVAEDEEYL